MTQSYHKISMGADVNSNSSHELKLKSRVLLKGHVETNPII